MFRNDRSGFSLAECMVALLILACAIRYILPALTQSFQENQVLLEHQKALTLLHNSLINWAVNNEQPPPTMNDPSTTHYQLNFSSTDHHAYLCVKWSPSKQRVGEECGEIKR